MRHGKRMRDKMPTKDTLPKLVHHNYVKYGNNRVAMRHKKFGIWQSFTYEDVYKQVKYFALGLKELGLTKEDKVSIIGDNEPEWFWAEYAVQTVGGVAVGIFLDCVFEEVEYIVTHSDSKIVIAKDQEQVDKILAIREKTPHVQNVIYWDDKGMYAYTDPFIKSWAQVVELGKESERNNSDLFDKMLAEGSGDDLAILSYTSGTTSKPKGAMITHKNLTGTVSAFFEFSVWRSNDEYLSYISPAWITEQMLGLTGTLIKGIIVAFPEGPETISEDVREIGPTLLLYTSRLWESLCGETQAKLLNANFIDKFLYKFLLPVGYRRADAELDGKPLSVYWKVLVKLADIIIFRCLRDRIGLSQTTTPFTGGATLGPDLFRWYRAIGIPLKQIYGSSEAGLCCCHREGNINVESIGQPLPGMEVKVNEDGEGLWRGIGIFKGYYKDKENTAKELKDGWWHSGDAIYIDKTGKIFFIDRMKDLMELSDGSKYSAQMTEARLKFSPFIRDAIIVGGKNKPFVSAIIQIDYDIVGEWAERNKIVYTTFTDLSQKQEIYELIVQDVRKLNESLPKAARIQKFSCTNKEFDPDEAELTRTRKLRRKFAEKKYSDYIDAIYSGKDIFENKTIIKYRDGRVGKMSSMIRVKSV